MTDSVEIDNETERLLDELARASGKTRDAVLKEAVRTSARAARAASRAQDAGDLAARRRRIMEAVERVAALPILDDRSGDEIIGYDERGLPR